MKLISADINIDFDEIETQHLVVWDKKIKADLEKAIQGSSGRVKDFYKEVQKARRQLLIGTPPKLRELRKKIEVAKGVIPQKDFEDEKVREKLTAIFNYSVFVNTYLPNWGAYKYVEELNINSCVYCNRIFSFTLDK